MPIKANDGDRHLPGAIRSGLAVCVIICTFFLASCGGTPPDHPLTDTNTTTQVAQTANPTASSAQVLPIKVIGTKSTLSTYPGGYMSMTITTSPYAISSFMVDYGLGAPSKDFGVIPQTTDANGTASWHWRVDSGAHTGTWPLTITAILPNGAKTTSQTNVNVTLAPISLIGSQTNLSGYPKQVLTLTIATAPSIDCTLQLNYGPGKPNKIFKSYSNSSGIASWTWRVDSTATAGVFPLVITAVLADGESSTAQAKMAVL